jgi:biotin carboxylase
VDRRYDVPDPERDWHEGRIQPNNTQREQAFIDAAVSICERENIDTIFPSNDPWTYVFSKNKKLFEERGIVVPVPDYETVIRPLDKYQTVLDAEAIGVPTPRSYLPEDEVELERIAGELDPPWILKPRFTTGGRGLAIAENAQQLRDKTREIRKRHGMPLVQEYIPGRDAQNFALVLDRDGNAVSVFSPRPLRVSGRVLRNYSGSVLSCPPHPLTDLALRLVRRMGWWGGVTVQTKPDPRDGKLKLLEVNPRLGTHLWFRTELGINEPLMCVKIARGEPVEPVSEYLLDYTLLDPIEDVVEFFIDLLDLSVYRVRVSMLRMPCIDPESPPRSLRETMKLYWSLYFSKRTRRFAPYFRHALTDPLPALIWASKLLSVRALRNMKGIGR